MKSKLRKLLKDKCFYTETSPPDTGNKNVIIEVNF